MKNPNLKLQAFTILEITITMLIVSILSAFVYYAVQSFTHLLNEQQVKKWHQYEFDLLCHQLRWDSYQSDSIRTADEGGLSFIDSLGIIDYHFLDSTVLRTQYALRTDTFHVRAEFPAKTMALHLPEEAHLITSFELPLVLDQKQVYLPIRKVYSAKQLIGDIARDKP